MKCLQILEKEEKRITKELTGGGEGGIEETDVRETTREMLSLLPEANKIHTQRVC